MMPLIIGNFNLENMMYNIVLDNIIVDYNIVYYNFSCSKELDGYFKSKQMFIEYPEDVSSVPLSILSIPFIATFLGISWLENTNLYVDELDSTYYYSLREVRSAFQDMYYNVSLKGRVVPCKIVQNNVFGCGRSLLLFGGGVDAHCSYIRHKDTISHIMNIQGWFSNKDDFDAAADADREHCFEFSDRMGVLFDYVKSNFASIVNANIFNKKFQPLLHDQWWHGIQHSMAFIAISIPIAFLHSISNIIIASSCTKGRIKPCGSFITTDSAFKFAGDGYVLHDAFELNRQDKIKVIVDCQKVSNQPYPLKVCSFNDRNCCECEKCFRTITEIIAEGGRVQDFGFPIKDSLVSFFTDVMNRKLGLWGMTFEREIYWKDTMKRMKENYDNITEKDFVDWFISFDFDKEQKRSRRNYYFHNFFAIIKRKLFIH